MKIKILLVCIHNVRNPVAAALLNRYTEKKLNIQSVWIESDRKVPLFDKVMREKSVNIAHYRKKGRKYFDLNPSIFFDYVITLCDEDDIWKCPVFPNARRRAYWNIPDPCQVEGTKKERLDKIREITNKIQSKVLQLTKDLKSHHSI